MSGANVTTVAASFLNLKRYDRTKVDGLQMTSDQIDLVIREYLALGPEGRRTDPRIGRDRHALIMSGAAILQALMRIWPTDRLSVADRGLREGMLVEGFDELGTLATFYNSSYYPLHLERLNYVKDVDWLEYEILLPEELPPSVARLAETLKHRYQLSLLEVRSKKELLRYADQLFQLLNEAYEHLYSVTPLTPSQVQAYIRQYFDFISPDFVPIILDGIGRLVAFGITLPSLSRALQKDSGAASGVASASVSAVGAASPSSSSSWSSEVGVCGRYRVTISSSPSRRSRL